MTVDISSLFRKKPGRRRTKAEPGSRLSELRQEAHRAFDAHWEFGGKTRNEAYLWLADQMKMDPLDCHMGMMDESECEWVIALCRGENLQPFLSAAEFDKLLGLQDDPNNSSQGEACGGAVAS